jgi:hypothetical protein
MEIPGKVNDEKRAANKKTRQSRDIFRHASFFEAW